MSKFLQPQKGKTLISYYVIETKLHQFTEFLLIVREIYNQNQRLEYVQNKSNKVSRLKLAVCNTILTACEF